MLDEMNPSYLQPGTRIGFYKVVTLVGKGGFGALYKVLRGGQVFALKLSTFNFSELSEDDRVSYMARAKREAGSLMQLRHPNVVQVHGFEHWPEIASGYPYLVMDFVDGFELYEWRKKQAPTLRQVVLVFQKISLALNEIHRCEIFHRDLKSANVLIRKLDGEPVVVDFGLARPKGAYTVTHAEDIVGSHACFTPEYSKYALSPGRKEKKPFVYRPTADLHAAGYMLYEVLAGRPPFDRGSDNQIDFLVQLEQKVPTRPSLINASVPGSLDDIAMKLLEKEPQNRFQTGAELGVALAKALEGADGSWDSPLTVPAPAKSDGQTDDERGQAANDAVRKSPKPQPVLSKTKVRANANAAQPAVSTAQEEAAPPGDPPAKMPNPTQPAAVPKPGFIPPSTDREAFVPPEGALSKASEETQQPSLASTLRKVQAANAVPSSRNKLPPILAGLGILLAAVFATAWFVAQRSKEARRPENLLAKFEQRKALPGSSTDLTEPTAPLAVPAPKSNPPIDADKLVSPSAPTKGLNSRHPGARGATTRNSDEANIDSTLAATYGRPKIPDKGQARQVASADPAWLQRGHRIDAPPSKQPDSASKKLGVPFGTHLRARLATNLDSRTIGDGLVEAALMRPFLKGGQPLLPSKTMLYGQAGTSNGRFTVHFFRMRLPDNTEVPFNALALDLEDNKPGLAPSARIAAPPASKESLATKVMKNTAGNVLGKLSGEDGADIARGAGQTALGHSDLGSSYGSSEALLLDAGRDFEVLVKEAF